MEQIAILMEMPFFVSVGRLVNLGKNRYERYFDLQQIDT